MSRYQVWPLNEHAGIIGDRPLATSDCPETAKDLARENAPDHQYGCGVLDTIEDLLDLGDEVINYPLYLCGIRSDCGGDAW